VYLGEMLTDILDQIERGAPTSTKKGGQLDLGAHTLPQIPRHSADRNRTSPFAFTGNKFEFRAIGSSQSVAWPNTVLNTIIAESLDEIATRLETAAGAHPTEKKLEAAVKEVLREVVRDHRRVVFDGDNYSAQWHEEAARRGLPHLHNTPDALPALASRKAVRLFEKYAVLSERELKARVEVLWEQYETILCIEARTMASMLRRSILPAAMRYQTELAQTVASTQAAGADFEDAWGQLQETVRRVDELRAATAAVAREEQEAHHIQDPERRSLHCRDRVLPAMVRARAGSDALEQNIPADLWTLPTYAQMLFER
jgi:glutamine synthetase